MALDEFALIRRYFANPDFLPPAHSGVRLGIGDDAAILCPPPNEELLFSIDTLVAGTHFPVDISAAQIAHRALAVNLSDLAAMGARPLWFGLALTLPAVEEVWLEAFSRALAALARRFDIALYGGDTTRGPLSITIQVVGASAPGAALRRDGAHIGDDLYISGAPGCAAHGLQRVLAGHGDEDPAAAVFLWPEPRIELGLRLRGMASAAIDVSDGLLADAGHLATRSALRIEIEPGRLPLEGLLAAGLEREQALALCLSGGDDYELCFSAAPAQRAAIAAIASALALPCTRIGTLCAGSGVGCGDYHAARAGYQHFEVGL